MFFLLLSAFLFNKSFANNTTFTPPKPQELSIKAENTIQKFNNVKPKIRTENGIETIVTKFQTTNKEIALTFDACRGGVDWDLINYLKNNNIPATFFWTSTWIKQNPQAAHDITKIPLFDIQNHGFEHKPCFVDNGSIYGIKAPKGGVRGVVTEIEVGNNTIEKITNQKTKFYRSGTAYYDDVCVQITQELGYNVAGFSVLGDKGATYSKDEVKNALLTAKSGDIVILHMNHPEKETAEGVMEAIPTLQKQGFKFVLLKNVVVK